MVLKNAKALKIDLSDVEDVVLSHNHFDHIGGLMTLRREFAKMNPGALSRVGLRDSMGLNRKTAVVSAVGSSFTLGLGIDPRKLAQ